MDLQLLTDALNKLTPQVFTYDRSIQSLKKGTRIIRKHPLLESGQGTRAMEALVKDIESSEHPVLLTGPRGVGGLSLKHGGVLIVGPVGNPQSEERKVLKERVRAVNALLTLAFSVSMEVSESNQEVPTAELSSFLKKLKDDITLPLPDWSDVVPQDGPHNTYAYELAHLSGVQEGDPEKALRALRSPMHGKEGRMGFTDLRHHKNSAIINAVLAARAAINGGLAVETAYTTADFFILAAEMAKTVEEARLLRETITWRFAELVSKVKERETRQYRAQVRLLINELNRNIFNPVTRKEIVACINRNIDYAERIFKEDVGMSMMEYLRQERIRVACDLLLNSQQKVGEIALLLNFSSSSHFARVFKEITGESPLDYRERLTLAPRRRLG